MSIQHVDALLSEFMDGALLPALQQKVTSHLVFCAECRKTLAELRENTATLKSVPAPSIPAGLEARIVRDMLNESEKSQDARKERFSYAFSLRFAGLSAAAAAAVFLVFMTPLFKGGPTTDQVTVDVATAQTTGDVGTTPASGVVPAGERRAADPEEITDVAVPLTAPAAVRDSIEPGEAGTAGVPPPAQEPATTIRTEPISVREIASAAGGTGTMRALPRPPREKTALTHTAFQTTRQEAPAVRSTERETAREETPQTPTPMKGPFSGIKEEGEFVVSKPREWRRLWARHMHNVAETAPLPTVDFDKEEVIAIFAGPCPSAGYVITINRIEETEWEGRPARLVRYSVQPPPAGTMAATVITHPYLFQVVPRLPHTFFRKNPQ